MKFVADESVERHIAERLRRDGHEVWSVAESSPAAPDESVLAKAAGSASILITADKDFGELVFRLRRASAGVILLRLAGLPNPMKAEIVAATLTAHGSEMAGAFYGRRTRESPHSSRQSLTPDPRVAVLLLRRHGSTKSVVS